ncbi:MAG TPA: HAD family phosphatase [Thermoanaerobaculia bacterium]|jgi:putative hydrolase of the HAD superfamily
MAEITWFIFDLGNTVIKLAYERVLENICKHAAITRDELVELLEAPGAYRDMERGAVKFSEFYDFLRDKAGYRGTLRDLQETWSDFFDGTLPGIEDLLSRLRQKYRIAFLSNSNEVHAEVIPRKFGSLFEKDDRMIFSHRFHCAKPDPEMFQRALEIVGALPHQAVLVDDLLENVLAARSVGMTAYQFRDSFALERDLTDAGLL